MKDLFSFFKQKVINGLLLLLPITLIGLLLAKLWTSLRVAVINMNTFLGLDRWMEVTMLITITVIALLIACFLTGIIAHMASVSIVRAWLEKTVLKHVPGYAYMQMIMEKKFSEYKDDKVCVMVKINHVWQPGLLIEENEYCSVVYFPNCPQPGSGITCMVDKGKVKYLNITVAKLNNSIAHFGKGLADAYAQCISKEHLSKNLPNYQ